MRQLDESAAETFVVTGLHSINHLIPKSSDRCGIYVLHFVNGDQYVGQAVDVVTRFATHRLNNPDIAEISFWRIPRSDLNTVEKAEILHRENRGTHLRNVVHTSGRLGASDFDILVPQDEQESWLGTSPAELMSSETRPPVPGLRPGNHVGFGKLIHDRRFAEIEFALRLYVAWTLPAPLRTELSYWTISARPGGGKRLLTLTVHNVETLFVYAPLREPDVMDIRLNVDLKVLHERWGSLDAVMDQFPGLYAGQPRYRARPGIAGLSVGSARDFVRLLSLDDVVAAARRLNLDLMRKGPALNWKSHCKDLADRLLAAASAPESHSEATSPDELYELGSSMDVQGRFDEAADLYGRAADAGHTVSMFSLGRIFDEQGRHDHAERCWQTAAAAGNESAMNVLGVIAAERGDRAEAKSWWLRAAGLGLAATNLGELYLDQGDLVSAETHFRRAVELGDLLGSLCHLGVLHEERGDLRGAESYYRRAADHDDTDAMVNLGLLLEARAEIEAAAKMFQRAADFGDEEALKLLDELRTSAAA